FGMTIEAMSGLTALCGYEDGPPQMMTNAFGDPFSGLNGVVAALMAWHERRRSGRGVHIELSQLEAFLPLTAGPLLDAQLNGRTMPRSGNRHTSMTPHGVYETDLAPQPPPLKGRGSDGAGGEADHWLALAVSTDREWQALCGVMERPELVTDQRYADVISRRRHERELDALVAEWAAARERDEALERLAEAGVPAAIVRANDEAPLH